jgi:hypothetical protein
MKTHKIIQVEINYRHELVYIKGSPSTFIYYSNLTLAYQSLKKSLLLNDWEDSDFNYTAIYRSLKQKEIYVKSFKNKGTPFFKISISKITVNPKLLSVDFMKKPA